MVKKAVIKKVQKFVRELRRNRIKVSKAVRQFCTALR